jgi:hypothetical protein
MLNKQKITEFRGDFETAVAQLEKQYGVNIALGTISFSANELRAKMTATVGDKVVKSSKSDFRIGDTVRIDHKKVPKDDQFTIVKINAKNIKVQKVVKDSNLVGAFINVSPSLLIKVG